MHQRRQQCFHVAYLGLYPLSDHTFPYVRLVFFTRHTTLKTRTYLLEKNNMEKGVPKKQKKCDKNFLPLVLRILRKLSKSKICILKSNVFGLEPCFRIFYFLRFFREPGQVYKQSLAILNCYIFF